MTDEHPHDRQQRERIGVAGDPVPDREYGDDPEDHRPRGDQPADWMDRVSGRTAATVAALESAGLLTRKQALAYVLREIRGLSRKEAAETAGVSISTHDTHIRAARKKVGQARGTATVIEDRQTKRERCDGCGTTLLPNDERTEHRAPQRAYTAVYCEACEDHRLEAGLRPEEHEQYRLRDDTETDE